MKMELNTEAQIAHCQFFCVSVFNGTNHAEFQHFILD